MKNVIRKRALAPVLVLLILLGLGAVALAYHRAHSATVISQRPSGTATPAKRPSTNRDTSAVNTTGGNQDKSFSSVAPVVLTEPSGQFVSNHHLSLSSSVANSHETSVCTDVPGASCQISFTKNSTTVSLDQKTTDNNGNAYWNWQLSDLNLKAGSWQIVATVMLNGQAKTATDPINLEVGP